MGVGFRLLLQGLQSLWILSPHDSHKFCMALALALNDIAQPYLCDSALHDEEVRIVYVQLD